MVKNYISNFFKTLTHKWWVFYYSYKIAKKIMWRAIVHDLSKFYPDEFKGFAKHVNELKKYEFGSPEYRRMLDELESTLKLHYSRNKHHPQYHFRGYQQMGFFDRVEMLADWYAATRRSRNGDILKSIDINKGRFQYSDIDKRWMTSLIEEIK